MYTGDESIFDVTQVTDDTGSTNGRSHDEIQSHDGDSQLSERKTHESGSRKSENESVVSGGEGEKEEGFSETAEAGGGDNDAKDGNVNDNVHDNANAINEAVRNNKLVNGVRSFTVILRIHIKRYKTGPKKDVHFLRCSQGLY